MNNGAVLLLFDDDYGAASSSGGPLLFIEASQVFTPGMDPDAGEVCPQ